MNSTRLLPLSSVSPERLKKIRLIATDIDGTVTKGTKIPPSIVETLLKLESFGIEVLPVTGRPSGEALGLARYLPGVRHAIAENGATFLIPEKPIEFLHQPPNRNKLEEIAQELSTRLSTSLQLAPDHFCRVGDIAFLRENRTEPELETMKTIVASYGFYLIWSSVHIHISELPPDKGKSALLIAKRFGYQTEEIASIGDAPNDAGLWVEGRFGLSVGTKAVMKQLSFLEHVPEFLVSEGADGWIELANAICHSKQM